MLDRESSFADRDVVETLKTRFVPLALDVWYEERRQDPTGDFFRKVVHQRPGLQPGGTTQGFYAFAPDGALLAGWNHRGVPQMKERLTKALASYRPTTAEALIGSDDPQFVRTPPVGGLVLEVHSRIVKAAWPKPADDFERTMQESSGFDHLWITKEEVAALVTGRFPQSLATRIARFHCIDNTRGEPPTWEQGEVKVCRFTATPDGNADCAGSTASLELEGELSLRTSTGDRGFDASLRGVIERKADAIVRFDLAIRGEFFGEGEYTRGAPPGKFTLAIVFTLADDGEHSKVPPQGARWLDDYLGKV